MAWETRNGNRYYYAKLRIGDKVTSVYLGSSPLAHQVAQEIEHRQAARQEEAQELDSWNQLENDIDALQQQIETCLIQAGLHRQNYGPWRKQKPTPSAKPA